MVLLVHNAKQKSPSRCTLSYKRTVKLGKTQIFDANKKERNIVQHRLPLNPECSPVKQKLRRMKPETSLKIKEESSSNETEGGDKLENHTS